MAAQRTRPALPADRRSIHPDLPGLPWWAAVAIGVGATTAGFLIDAVTGAKELSWVFAALYALGCVAAVLVVRQSGVFTAVIQPPLILFCTVPSAYWLFHRGDSKGIKGILINCGYPLIERFPLMLFTSAAVLLIGLGRWYFAAGAQPTGTSDGAQQATATGWLASTAQKLAAKLTAALNQRPAHAVHTTAPRRQRAGDRPRRSSGAPRRFAPTASGHGRARPEDTAERRTGRPQRPRRPQRPQRSAPPYAEEPRPRRRPRPPQDSGRRDQSPREVHRDRRRHTGRTDPYRPAEPPEPRRRRRVSDTGAGAGGGNGMPTHHPISQVRYRSPDPEDESRRPRPGRAESWQYDI